LRKISLLRKEAIIYPDLYGKAAEKGISRLLFPEEEERKMQELLLINEQNKLTQETQSQNKEVHYV
jgi:hypothetical protein